MAAENYQKKELLSLMSTGANKLCVDCNAPSPQWASVTLGTFICLECSGIHRGFGVHISFVRSITMDKWSDDQFRKMKLGGNEAFKSFIESYGPEGGYTKGMSMQDKYASWAVTQYREKLAAECADPPEAWSKSSPPPEAAPAPATRRSRAGAAGSAVGSGVPSRSSSPYVDNLIDTGYDTPPSGSGSGNEAFFERLGNANAARSSDLPPSQGGKYGGFGNTPEPSSSSSTHPSYGMSSHAAPSLDDFQRNPLGALSKGWGLFSSAVATAGKEINESVVKPAAQRANELYEQGANDDMKRYFASAQQQAMGVANVVGQRAHEGWGQFNDVAKKQAGVDFNEQFGRLGLGKGSERDQGYGQVSQHAEAYDDNDDFFDSWDSNGHGASAPAPAAAGSASAPAAAKKATDKAAEKKKGGWDDDWNDF